MINEMRNELLLIKQLKNQGVDVSELLERFENDINDQLKETKRKQANLLENLDLLKFIKEDN